jgi:hypothetical protein
MMGQSLSEFLYSAILWGSLGTALTWWLWRSSKNHLVRRILIVPLVWTVLHTAFAWYGFVVPPSGRLTDTATGQPHPNRRVIATWFSYPIALWTSYCSGRQAHLSDSEGNFSFRFAPWPTLVFGSVVRGLNPEILGRIDNRSSAVFPLPLFGDILTEPYVPEHDISWFPNTECKEQIAVQYPDAHVLPGEANQFEAMRREACVVGSPWTLTDLFMLDLSRAAEHLTSAVAPPVAIQELLRTFGQHGCRPGAGGVCARPISDQERALLCAYYGTLR